MLINTSSYIQQLTPHFMMQLYKKFELTVVHSMVLFLTIATLTHANTFKSFKDPDTMHDGHHIQEHYEGQVKVDPETMTDEEKEFHYFKQHDSDDSNTLDGIEIYQAIAHMMPYDPANFKPANLEGKSQEQIAIDINHAKDQYVKQIEVLVDTVLKQSDVNDDGYISYFEFKHRYDSKENKNN
ncbi:unnamed protein product [Owenia fusiformis]|uniref:EF-hand domain-containing protein n=1 Tax=Owenia fusiformis TaxID=6347 RepID=A0A8S4PFQ2_OWEFU|nr:unnamed protein product [Owenia fusiformis]